MVIKIWQYDSALDGVASPKLKQSLAFSTSLSRARYIFDIQLSAEDLAVMEQVKPVGDYVHADKARGHRIEGRYAYNLVSEDPEGRSQELALYGARAGLKRFWHLTVSSREDEKLTPQQLEHVRAVVCRVLGVSDCPSIWADHRDTDNDHCHGLVVSFLPAEDRPVTFGQEWWKEAGQIAMAIIERDLGLEPEPNRRFVADQSGVYHTFSDIQVADKDGKLLDRTEIISAQRAHRAWKRSNYAAQVEHAGTEWDMERAVQTLAKPRIEKAQTAAEMHASLARVGLKYVAGKSGARIVANGYRQAPGQHSGGQSVAAGKAYSNAALGKLSNRLKGGYTPAAHNLHVRKFVMPRFEKLTDDARGRFADRRAEIEECTHLAHHLEKHNAHFYRKKRAIEHGANVNEQRAHRRRSHQEELAEVKALEKSLARPFQENRPFPKKDGDPLAILWGPPPGRRSSERSRRQEEERRELEDRYRIESTGWGSRYWLGDELAFVARLRTIQIFSQKRRVKIDALRLARRKFRRLRIASAQKIRKGLARIAAELEIVLDKGPLQKLGATHIGMVVAGVTRGIVASSRAYHRTLEDREALRPKARDDRRVRDNSVRAFKANDDQLRIETLVYRYALERQELAEDAPDPSRQARRRLAEEIDHNALLLAPSRHRASFEGISCRFLDDPVLVRAFEDNPHRLVDPDVQRDLAAIEAVQIERRRWIAAAIVAGAASVEEDELVVRHKNASWAPAFWQAQRSDPTFRRLIAVARARPDRFPFDTETKPGEKAFRHAKARGLDGFATAIAREMRYGIKPSNKLASEPGLKAGDGALPQAAPPREGSDEAANSERHRLGASPAPVPDRGAEVARDRNPYPGYPNSGGFER